MSRIEINHSLLHNAIHKALNDYSKLPHQWFHFFSSPGEVGRVRASILKTELEALSFLTQIQKKNKLEIIFCAIVKSVIFHSFMGRFKNCLLKYVMPGIVDFHFLMEKPSIEILKSLGRQYREPIRANPIFTNLEQFIHFDTRQGEKKWVDLYFSHIEVLDKICEPIYRCYLHEVDELIGRINNVRVESSRNDFSRRQ